MNSFQICLLLVFIMGNVCFGKSVQKDHHQSKKKHHKLILNKKGNRSYFRENPNGPGTYAFGYYINDEKTGNFQIREEEKFANRSVIGVYGHLRPDNIVSVTHYTADERGYISNTKTYTQDKYKPNKLIKKRVSTTMKPTNLTFSEDTLNTSTISPKMVENIFNKHINLFPTNQTNGLDSQTSSIINGGASIKTNRTGTIGFSTLNDFIPQSFPIIPFQLPKNIANSEDKN